jgi:hypothetical protein
MLLAKAEWGTLPDRVSALGTVAAFFVGLRLLAKELAARHEQEQDRRRAQARLVNTWLAANWRESDGELEGWFVVQNASDEPIYQVKITVVPRDSKFASDPEAARGIAPAVKRDLALPLQPHERYKGDVPADWNWGLGMWSWGFPSRTVRDGAGSAYPLPAL